MGLDMYLTGKFYFPSYDDKVKAPKFEGIECKEMSFELGYWRKQPDLHGFIVQEFAEGVDECQEIWMDKDRLNKVIDAVKKDSLAKGTTGFFFGAHDYSKDERKRTLEYLQKAVDMIDKFDDRPEWFNVYYQASW